MKEKKDKDKREKGDRREKTEQPMGAGAAGADVKQEVGAEVKEEEADQELASVGSVEDIGTATCQLGSRGGAHQCPLKGDRSTLAACGSAKGATCPGRPTVSGPPERPCHPAVCVAMHAVGCHLAREAP